MIIVFNINDEHDSHLTPVGVPSQDVLDNDRAQGEGNLYLCLDVIADHLLQYQLTVSVKG